MSHHRDGEPRSIGLSCADTVTRVVRLPAGGSNMRTVRSRALSYPLPPVMRSDDVLRMLVMMLSFYMIS